MSISTLTSKGQVTIPKIVRERLHLRTGDKLDFRVEEDGTIRVYPIARKVSEVFGLLAEKAGRAYSAKESREKLREAFKKGKV
jgi:AbrB family looped-hinge helix DNA binding protein